ncbi:MAG: tetratricopeptide repeat protein, partial [Spirochaetaceae bacterium]|nr:tetratricopeptide repeat protein [Spirochaetaceae bacterium]
GGIRVWETLRGRQLFFFHDEHYAGVSALAFAPDLRSLLISAGGAEYVLDLPPLEDEDSALSPEGPPPGALAAYRGRDFSLAASDDGSLILRDEHTGTELFRYYCLAGENGPWLCMGSGAWYDTGGGTARADAVLLLEAWGRERPLSCFAELLFRPGLLSPDRTAPFPDSLLEKRQEPPRLRFKGEVLMRPDGREAELSVTVSGQKGAEALAVLYRRDKAGHEFPVMLFPLQGPGKDARSYDTVVKLPLEPGENHMGLSVFNRERTVESERLWVSCYAKPDTVYAVSEADAALPLLHVVSDSSGNAQGRAEFDALLSRQDQGELYSAVETHNGLGGLLDAVFSSDDVLLFFLDAADSEGDFSFLSADGDGGVHKLDFLRSLPRLGSEKNIFIFNLNFEGPESGIVSSGADDRLEAAFRRLVRWLEPSPVLLAPSPPEASGQGAAAFFAVMNEGGEPYPAVSTVFAGMERLLAEQGRLSLAFLPESRLYGDLRIIDRDAGRGVSVPGGGSGGSPGASLFSGLSLQGLSLQGLRPGLGVSFAELDPANYRDFNPRALAAMGVEPYMILYLSGRNLYLNGQYDKAIEEYTRSIGLNAAFAAVYAARGNAYNRKGDFGPAVGDYSRALRLEPDSAEVYNYRGFAYAAGGDFGRAIEDYSRAIGGRTGYADAYYNRARAYEGRGEHEKAIADYSKVIELEPRNASAYNRRGCVFYDLFDDDRAIRDFGEAIRLASGNAVYYHNRGNAWYSKGDYERALADLNQALALDPRYVSAYRSRAAVWQKKGNTANASRDLEAALGTR